MNAIVADGHIVPLARSHVYGFLALGFAHPDHASLGRLNERMAVLRLSLSVLEDQDSLAAAGRLDAQLGTLDSAALEASNLHCFGHCISKECPPYEGEYGMAHIFQKSQCLADIAGFYRAFGMDLARDFHDRADHLCAELEFLQWLCLKEAHAFAKDPADERLTLCRDAQGKFLHEHLGRWALTFARTLTMKAGMHFHGLLSALLATFVASEMRAFGLETVAEAPLADTTPVPGEDINACGGCPAAGVVNIYEGRST